MPEITIPRIITWRKWVDPLGRNLGEFEYIPEKDVKNLDNNQNDLYNIDDDEDNEVNEGPTPVVITPMGILPLKPFNDPTKVFNFWLGETSFPITGKVAETLNEIDGVEILDIFTRYKFRIAIGNNFPFQYVRQLIEKSLEAVPQAKKNEPENMLLDANTKAQVQKIIQAQLKKFEYWAVYVCPNGQVDISASHEKNLDFDECVATYITARKLAGGAIFKYDEPLT